VRLRILSNAPHGKQKGFKIHISTWNTERRAHDEAINFDRDVKIKSIVEKVVVRGRSKYAVRVGVFSNKSEVLEMVRKLLK
jgi:hypothetical protein